MKFATIFGKNIKGIMAKNRACSSGFVFIKKYLCVADEKAIIPKNAVKNIMAISRGFVIQTHPLGSAGFSSSTPDIRSNSGLKKNIKGKITVLRLYLKPWTPVLIGSDFAMAAAA